MVKTAGFIVELRDVHLVLRGGRELQVDTLAVEPGQRVALFGGTGAGKSLLLRLLGGTIRPGAGQRIAAPSLGPPGGVQLVPRYPKIPAFLTPQQVLALAYRGMGVVQRAARTAEALAAADLYGVRHRPLYGLSEGSRLALSVAKAAAMRPALLLLDDCTRTLPEPVARRIWQYLEDRRAEDGLTVVFATTRSDEAEEADRVVLMDGGRILRTAPPHELLAAASAHRVTVEALDARQVSRTIRGGFDLEVEDEDRRVTFRASDGGLAAADLFRHAGDIVRMVTVRRPSLWDVLDELRRL
ncbi:MAG: ATP-binding cassette domain-containing protein [Chthonomonadales bacterium]